MKILVCSVKGAIRREYFSPATTADRRAFLMDHWGAEDIAEVMLINAIRRDDRFVMKEFTFSDGTRGAVRTRVAK